LNTMISSFRDATDEWLNQRLAADLYLRGSHNVGELENWLTEYKTGLKVAERYRTGITRPTPSGASASVELVSLQDGDRFLQGVRLMRADNNAKTKFRSGDGLYISERAWRIDGWNTGMTLELCSTKPEVPVLGIYRDYGNPRSQWMVHGDLFLECFPAQIATSLAVLGPADEDWDSIRSGISETFDLEDNEIINQNELKQVGLAVFDRTFAVTRALNALTLLVAAIGIFCAISAIHHHRVAQQALLSSLGMTRLERGVLLLLQWGILGLLCMVLVWPFGTALAAYLASVVTPVAFGWSFPLRLDWLHYLVLTILASCSLVLAVFLPSLRLLHTSPAAMLREQNI
jgi:putative ABC transport system permease protein